MAREVLRRLAHSPVVGRALALAERLDSANPRILRVLTYHRVDEAEPFARQMDWLAARYRVISIARLQAALDGGAPLPPRAVLLTFDDAYRSFAEVAWPILESHGFRPALFVPTAYPDRPAPRFWWDRLEQAFARTTRRDTLAGPDGPLSLATPEERARAHRRVKQHVKDLAHARTLAVTEEVCTALGVPREPHEVLGWDALRTLARQGVTLGAHSRTHPRLDRVGRAEARAEVLDSVRELEQEIPGQPRVFAYPDGRFDDELVEVARAAGVELAFTTRRGTNDLGSCDRLRLRRMHVDARDSVEVLRAKLVFSAARLEPATRLLDPPSASERRAEAGARRERRRSQFVLRSLDAALTASLRPRAGTLASLRRVARRRASRYERIGGLVRWAETGLPALEPRLRRALLDPARLPLRAARLALAGFGSGTTVFRLDPAAEGAAPRALKIYRRSLGRAPELLANAARRYRQRYRLLCERFGAAVLPAEFLVLHAPLRGAPAVACLQPWLEGPNLDLLGLEDGALLERLAADGLEQEFAAFARAALAWRARGAFPDLLGRGNLVVARTGATARLLLLDYGLFDLGDATLPPASRAGLEALARRFRTLLERIGRDVDVLG